MPTTGTKKNRMPSAEELQIPEDTPQQSIVFFLPFDSVWLLVDNT